VANLNCLGVKNGAAGKSRATINVTSDGVMSCAFNT
jgi:hypothetical protein